MKRVTLDKFMGGMVAGVVLTIVLGLVGVFVYTRLVQQIPGDIESSVTYMIYSPPITHELAVEKATTHSPDLVIREISLDSENGLLLRDIEFEDDSFIMLDANDGSLVFTGTELAEEDDDSDDDDDDELFHELAEIFGEVGSERDSEEYEDGENGSGEEKEDRDVGIQFIVSDEDNDDEYEEDEWAVYEEETDEIINELVEEIEYLEDELEESERDIEKLEEEQEREKEREDDLEDEDIGTQFIVTDEDNEDEDLEENEEDESFEEIEEVIEKDLQNEGDFEEYEDEDHDYYDDDDFSYQEGDDFENEEDEYEEDED